MLRAASLRACATRTPVAVSAPNARGRPRPIHARAPRGRQPRERRSWRLGRAQLLVAASGIAPGRLRPTIAGAVARGVCRRRRSARKSLDTRKASQMISANEIMLCNAIMIHHPDCSRPPAIAEVQPGGRPNPHITMGTVQRPTGARNWSDLASAHQSLAAALRTTSRPATMPTCP